MPTFEPRTDFSGVTSDKDANVDGAPRASGPNPGWTPDPANPYAAPPGIPQGFWDNYVQGQLAQDLLSKPGADVVGILGGLYKNYALPAWQAASPAQKKEYTDAEESGNPHIPGTAESAEWQKRQDELDTREFNQGEFEQWQNEFMPGVRDAMSAAQGGDKDALAKLQETLGGIKDPEIAGYVGDYASQAAQAGADPRDIAAQERQLAKFEAQTDARISPEEKLMMELSRRQTESDLRGQRGAIANSLQARGVYGSGAEITQNAMAQQEAASRQALEMLGAQSNASKRAMDALKGAGDLSTAMRGSSAQESQARGSAADISSQFNNKMRESYNQWKNKAQAEANAGQIDRAKTSFDATTGLSGNQIRDAVAVADLGLRGTQGKTGTLSGDTRPVSASFSSMGALNEKRRDEKKLEEDY